MIGEQPLVINMSDRSGSHGSDLILDPSHHKIILSNNDFVASISFAISARSLADEGFIDAQVYTNVQLLPEVAASLTADISVSFTSDVSLAAQASVSTTPTDANTEITVEGNAAGAQLTTAGHIELIATTFDGKSHIYGVDFQGDAGILDFEFAAPNGTSNTSLAWAAEFLNLHTGSSIMADSIMI
jgi:hypothetical protein